MRRVKPAILPLCLLFGIGALIASARGTLEGNPRFRVDPTLFSVDRPVWMPEALAVEIGTVVSQSLGPPASLLGEEGLSTWASRAAMASPWVQAVPVTNSLFPYKAELHLSVRRPVLIAEGLFWAADGTQLGESCDGIIPPPLLYDGVLDESLIKECAASAGEILPYRSTLAEKDVGLGRVLIDREGLVAFQTAQGVDVVWGRSKRYHPLAIHDLPPTGRLDNLWEVLEQYPGLERVSRVELHLDRATIHPGP